MKHRSVDRHPATAPRHYVRSRITPRPSLLGWILRGEIYWRACGGEAFLSFRGLTLLLLAVLLAAVRACWP